MDFEKAMNMMKSAYEVTLSDSKAPEIIIAKSMSEIDNFYKEISPSRTIKNIKNLGYVTIIGDETYE